MKVLITGASGFLGSWICRVLGQEQKVIGLVRESSKLDKLSDLNNLGMVRLKSSLWPDYIIESRPDILILNHWSGVESENRNSPQQFKNIDAIRSLAEAAAVAGVKTIIGTGSQAELGPIDSTISEAQIDNPTTLYGEAKVMTRLALEEITSGGNTRFVWMRVFSTYGPLDTGAWLIPNIVDSLVNDRKVALTKGEQQWSYLHAYDLALAFQTVIQNFNVTGTVNVGNPQTISIFNVASIIGEMLNKENLLAFGELEYRIDQVMRLQPKCEKLASVGWQPQINFLSGIRQTVDWLQRKELHPLEMVNGEFLNFKIPSRP
jgi:UDP-glucose 4-epimerase